jgi:RNA polymerase sigma-70 factor (ECF subfamily)
MIEDMSNNDEEGLISKLQALDLNAMTFVFDQYNEAIYRYSYRLLGSQDKAEECVAETFSKFLIAIQKGHGPKKFVRPYLYRIAHNWITDQYRRPIPEDEGLPENLQTEGDNPEQITISNMENHNIRRILQQIPSNQRQSLVLKYLEGMDNREIAQVLRRPVGAVKALQHRGLENIRKKLKVKP